MEMVVVSSNWVKNVAPYLPTSTDEEIIENPEQENGTSVPKAILICRPNSHQFEVRTVFLQKPVKVGRSVARAKPASNNAIFDCKVLSRHHALLWYNDGKFYLQDTKSSNGTFVNNNKLAEEECHEVSSGDIIQFGVDVLENNRKVTHGCIIATLKLYLPDGKEAKASPSITEGDMHGMVPLDDLYKLNQIIQEANQREQCLETKLNALQNVVEETKKSAEESWQAYVGEERLLSRLSALETQLHQANKNWSEDRLKEEIAKLREINDQYQEAAKLALERVHAEKLEAVNLGIEQERSKISAQQDALLSKEQLAQAQLEIQDVVKKLTEMESRAEEEKEEHARQVQELQHLLEEEEAKVSVLELKLYRLTAQMLEEENEQNDRSGLILNDDLKNKKAMLLQDDPFQNYISLVVAPVEEKCENEKSEEQCESENKDEEKEIKKVSFILPEIDRPESPTWTPFDDSLERNEDADSKTLKYQYQSAQKEQHQLQAKIHELEKTSDANRTKIAELEHSLTLEKELSERTLSDGRKLQEELISIERKWHESCEENRLLRDKICALLNRLEADKEPVQKCSNMKDETDNDEEMVPKSHWENTFRDFCRSEDYVVKLEEKYAQLSEEKRKLHEELLQMTAQYHQMVDRVQNKLFFYVAPLVFVIIYLLINAWFS